MKDNYEIMIQLQYVIWLQCSQPLIKAANDGEHILYFIGQTYVSAKCTAA